ncbi:MAG: porin [Parvibaculum sp.]
MQLNKKMGIGMLIAGLGLPTGSALAEDLPSREEMWKVIQAQQAQISELSRKLTNTDEKVEATGEAMETIAASGSTSTPGWWQRTSIGGYGELHYNGGKTDRIDFHRFVLFFGHEFNDDVRMFSEVEIEHALAGEGQPGEVELEQAFLEFDLGEYHALRAGVQLIPVGIMNETHEPPTFYGVERNQVETNIIPTTWWEAGLGVSGELGEGFSYDLMYHSGLEVPTTGGNAFRVRNGRQKVANADARDGATTGRLSFTGIPGVEVATSVQYQEDLTQGSAQATPAVLVEGHVDANYALGPGTIGLRALAAVWDLDSTAAAAIGRDEQYGWYVEPSYRFGTDWGDLGFFVQYAEWDNSAGDAADSVFSQTRIGANFWPTPDTVFKIDYQFDDAPTAASEDNRLNVGLGYQF